ncbi:MAG: hypothetical protein ABW067_06595 [Rhizobacter sp.]
MHDSSLKELPIINAELRLTYPISNEVERPGVSLVIQDEDSGLPLLRVRLTDQQFTDLLASRGVHVVGRRTPMVHSIGKRRRSARVLIGGYVSDKDVLEALYVDAETDAEHNGWHSMNRYRDRGGDWLQVSYWGDGGPSEEMLEQQKSRAVHRLAEATGKRGEGA